MNNFHLGATENLSKMGDDISLLEIILTRIVRSIRIRYFSHVPLFVIM